MKDKDKLKILLIEDEEVVRLGLEDNLRCAGYTVIACGNGRKGLEEFSKSPHDLVILDVMMPEMDGLEVCRQIRALGRQTPIMMLTAKCSEVDKVVGLELGADDYLTKPFGISELCARVKALLRRANALPTNENATSPCQRLRIGEVSIDFKAYRATRGKREIILSAKEFELLRYLASQPDVPVTRDQLLDNVWGYNCYPTTRTVDNFIARLRHKVEVIPEKPRHILTVHGVGYKFVQ
ncbi:MAG: response regulator transcription factor [Deltaproteobacteria bacterium]|nr:response regulator transcription factor [Deltaproteobacteria bacterium]